MNFFESEILKGKYFLPQSRDRLRATMINLFILAASSIILLYAYENLIQGYYLMLGIEMLILFTLMVVYVIFPYYINVINSSYIILGALTFLIALSFVVPDKDPELSLFLLAVLPIFIFFFLGVEKGIRWSRNMFVILLFIPFVSFISGIQFVYGWALLAQIIFGYFIVTYMLYIIEKERSSYEEQLAEALNENQMLFKEVHHRTKNNLQIIMGLLETQSFKIDDIKYKKMFETHVDRLKAMSLMHKNLYSNHSYEAVNIQAYLKELANSLKLYTHHNIVINIDPIMLDMKIAMSIGLIFNEAVTNSIEHAFDLNEIGEINVTFKHTDEHCIFILYDNGKGFDMNAEYKSLGITLIKDLSSTLLNSRLSIKKSEGTLIEIYFNLEEDTK